ncbi:MAG: adenylate/guanylate cyclase domain-containing protein, partial [Anaerolineales bacterium]
MDERQRLEQAIATQESLRGMVADEIINATISALRKQLEQVTAAAGKQRKLVSVLFTDVVHSTVMVRDLDPEENLEIMDNALKQLAIPVEEHGGRVTRFMGDGFKAVFGAPVAHENDPEMAVRAGLSILEISKRLASELEAQRGIHNFQVRVGINTGLAAI